MAAAHTDEVAKSKSRLFGALAILVLVGALGGTFVAVGGVDMVANLIAGDSSADEIVAPVPSETPATTTEEPAEEPAEEPVEAEAEEPAETDEGDTSSAAVPVAAPPTGDQQYRMYAEQVASQEQIGRLVRGEISSLSLGAVTMSGSTASVRVTANSSSGSVSGTMVLRDYNGVWYFSSITRDGNSGATPTPEGSSGVISAIITAQANNQAIPTGIINGGYKTLTVNGVSGGSGTASIQISLSGGSAPRTAGTITCVSKDIGGVKHWFITSFAKN
ncbi:MAG: hypothetical protein JXP72_08085 [Coriobacteriia bacterium]|nr:hypothetical protein [Coriobacteriia bacterium]